MDWNLLVSVMITGKGASGLKKHQMQGEQRALRQAYNGVRPAYSRAKHKRCENEETLNAWIITIVYSIQTAIKYVGYSYRLNSS